LLSDSEYDANASLTVDQVSWCSYGGDPMSSHIPSLFLHGGPGLSAIGERIIYGQALPVSWWDQPRSVTVASRPYLTLLDAAIEKALALANGGKIHLIGHSFGALLAHRLSLRIPGRIASLTLLAPAADLADVFIRLAAFMTPMLEDAAPLAQASARLQAERRDFTAAREMLDIIFSVPQFLNAYWSPMAKVQQEWYASLMQSEPVFDPGAFFAIAADAWDELGPPAVSAFDGQVDIIYGSADVLVDSTATLPMWQSAFRHVSSRTVRSGHMIQFECAPEEWWPVAFSG
jgi:pimeloyl-ACP methyl ester carboxylesterase